MDAGVGHDRYATPTGAPCPRCLRIDGTVEGSGSCTGCGTCLLAGGLLDDPAPDDDPYGSGHDGDERP